MRNTKHVSQQDSSNDPAALAATARTAEPADGGREAAEQGTPPTNRVPNGCNDYFTPLRWGVDSLYFSYPGRIRPELIDPLNRLKKLAQAEEINDQALAQYPIEDHTFEVLDRAVKGYAYVLEDGAFRITLTRGKQRPQLVKVSAGYLSFMDPKQVGEAVDRIMAELIELADPPNVTRIDLFVDFVSPEDMEWHRRAWVTHADAVWNFVEGDAFTGWMIGAGSPLVCRLYDKHRQAQKLGLKYLFALWRAVGWDGESRVWRLEFQMRGEVLRQFGLRTLRDVLGNLNGLWSYATTEWLRLAIPQEGDQTRSRWPIHPLWGYVSSIDWESNGGPLSREFRPIRVPSDGSIVKSALGALTGVMAKQGITDIRSGINALFDLVEEHYSAKAYLMGQPYEAYVGERVALKCRQFNTVLNDEEILERIEEERIAEAADRYERGKNGLPPRSS